MVRVLHPQRLVRCKSDATQQATMGDSKSGPGSRPRYYFNRDLAGIASRHQKSRRTREHPQARHMASAKARPLDCVRQQLVQPRGIDSV